MSRGKTGGIIQGFLGGASKGIADAGKMMLQNKLAMERDEANSLRDNALRRGTQDDRQEFLATEGDKRDAAALERTQYQVDNKPPKNKQTVNVTVKGEEFDAILNDDGTYTLPSPAGGQSMENISVSTASTEQAAKEYSEKASMMESDESQFGMSEKKWKKKRALEIEMELQSGKKPATGGGPGIVNSATDINRDTPAMDMPAPEQSAPKAALDAVMKDEKLLPQFIKKYGYDPTKQ